jgi:hypothetical protein
LVVSESDIVKRLAGAVADIKGIEREAYILAYAESLLKASGLGAEIVSLRAQVKALRDAAEQMVRFNDLPWEAKRPDVFNLRLLALCRALDVGAGE